jgi:UDP-2,4-diacetamido-2,4,6-trideoxy-beta-L-altropyranose hydrolase
MRVVFRVDASLQMGTGHVMRCLTLAKVLKGNGVNVEFICRKHEGNLIDKIRSNGFNTFELELLEDNKVDNKLFYSHWLGSTQQQDAKDCLSVLQLGKVHLLIVDHYGIDEDWQQDLKAYYDKLMVIDDLADRKHQCDILLDQTFGCQQRDYESLVPTSCKLLLGSQYALLRPEFIKWRQYSLERRKHPVFKQLLINMGGVDVKNITEKIVKELKSCKLPSDLSIVVVMGAAAPHLKSVIAQVNDLPYNTEVEIDVKNMAEIMANSDIAIGASGTTTWERCCLGVPSIQMVLANNQIEVAKKLDSVGASYYLERIDWLCESIDNLSRKMQKTIIITSSVTDGRGVGKVLSCMGQDCYSMPNLSLKPVALSDCNFVYTLQTKGVRKYFKNPAVPTFNEHNKWFEKIIKAKEIQLFILILDSQKAGVLRLDKLNDIVYEISIIISPNYARQGVAKNALKMVEDILLNRTLKAVIHKDNAASIKVFKQAGFRIRERGKNGVFVNYYKNII